MALTQEQFDELVARLEQEAAQQPKLYSIKLGLFASLGYLYVFTILGCMLLVSGLLVASLKFGGGMFILVKNLIIPLVILIGIVVRSMWVRLDEPQGLELTRRDYPELFAMLNELRHVTRAPRVHTVLLTDELNAAVVQVPRLGMFGWQKNFLLLGLPLMLLLPAEEFKAVLAHEFGHLSGAHGRFGAWIYRVRATWQRLAETLQEKQHWGSFLFVPFFAWFAPQFAAYSFVKARQQEYEADQLAAETVGERNIANALIRVDIKGQDLDGDYWPSVYDRAKDVAEPDVSPFKGLNDNYHRRFLPAAGEQLEQALLRRTSTADTHPCLKDRVNALGMKAVISDSTADSAAEILLGGALETLIDKFDAEWRENVSPWWKERNQYVADARKKLVDLESQDPGSMSDEDLFTRAVLTEDIESTELALPLYQALADRKPTHQGADFAVARIMLQQGEQEGIDRIENVMAANPDAVIPGCELIMGYLERQGRVDEIAPYSERYWAAQELAYQVYLRRSQLLQTDRFLPHDLSPENVALLEQLLRNTENVKSGLLVRKELPEGDPPFRILGIETEHVLPEAQIDELSGNIARQIEETMNFEYEIAVLPLAGENKPFGTIFNKIEDAEIYRH